MTAFSFTIVFTKIAIGGLSPLFIGAGRAVVAAAIAGAALSPDPAGTAPGPAVGTVGRGGGGVVAGFPLLTSYALTVVPASHGAIVVALLPAATAVCAVLRGHERHRPRSGHWPPPGPWQPWCSPWCTAPDSAT